MPEFASPKRKYHIYEPLLLSLVLAIGLFVGFNIKKDSNHDGSLLSKIDATSGIGYGRVEEILKYIEAKYVDSIDAELLVDEAIESIMSKLDPHSVYIPPVRVQEINNSMNGLYMGLGIETIFIRDTLNITKVLDDSPASQSDLHTLDKIISINGVVIKESSSELESIRDDITNGNIDELKIKIVRKESKVLDSINVVPGLIKVPSVHAFMQTEHVGYFLIDKFSSKVYSEFMKEFEELQKANKLEHIIIDVRDNPGGFLPETTKILSQLFQEKDRMLVYTKGQKSRIEEYKSSGHPFFPIDKVAILINENSASGSEILAGAIQDWDRGLVIGQQSFGKGLVQEQYDLQNGGALRLTVAKYFTPTGRLIQKPYSEYAHAQEDVEVVGTESVDSSSLYQTKLKKRPVFSNGGIIPDIIIPTNPLDELYYNFDLDSHVDKLMFQYYSDHQDMDGTALQKLLLADKESLLANFEGYLKSVDMGLKSLSEFSGLDEMVFDSMRFRLAYFSMPVTQYMQYCNQSDQAINEALSSFKRKDMFVMDVENK